MPIINKVDLATHNHNTKVLLQYLRVGLLVILTLVCRTRAQVRPVEGLHEYTPRVYALTGGTIHTEAGKVLSGGTILLRDGLIQAVSRKVDIPPDATIIDLQGKTVYAGFIESYWEIASGSAGEEATPADTQSAITRHWNGMVNPSRTPWEDGAPSSKELDTLRGLGFTTAQVAGDGGIFRGRTGVVHLNQWGAEALVSADVVQALAFDRRPYQKREYPVSLLGTIALIRQTILDAQWYSKAWNVYRRYPQANEHPEVNADLEALAASLARNQPFMFTTDDELASLRAGEIAAEFGVPLWVAGNGYEYRRLASIKQLDAFWIVPLNFPAPPDVSTLEAELEAPLADLRHWDLAPDNPHLLHQAGVEFAISSGKLQKRDRFKGYLARAVQRGFDRERALAALTTIPARRLGLESTHGRIQEGYVANLVVTDGDYFAPNSKVLAVWIAGEQFVIEPEPVAEFRGNWELHFPVVGDSPGNYALVISGKSDSLEGELSWTERKISLGKLILTNDRISWTLPGDSLESDGVWRFSGTVLGDQAAGRGIRSGGDLFAWSANRTGPYHPDENQGKQTVETASTLVPLTPEGAFGREASPAQPEHLLVRNATIWTSGPQGIIIGGDLLVERGKIAAIGTSLQVPRKAKRNLIEIDAGGKHVTAGVIDAHSHAGMATVNEGTQAITAEVRIRDVIDSDDISLYRQLAGGVTMLNGLHGSSNPIGGQNAVLKLRWGAPPAEMVEKRAPQGIKFALGENVKRSNWSVQTVFRYPQTRMGVDQIIRDALRAAQDYRRTWERYRQSQRSARLTPPRRDLEMEALVEILEGSRLVHAHSYRQDEVLNLIRIADDFKFTIGTLTHILEGYKVAPEIAAHGAGASCFSDWWAYKMEVYDAIPYAGALMAQAGVVTSFNSDDDELATRLNTEAAKAVKYGGLPEEEAWNFVTINSAIQLGVDSFTGSLEIGKDADFVIWSGHPMSTFSRCEQTWIDGRKYFDIDEALVIRNRQASDRAMLVQKILSSPAGSGEKPDRYDDGRFHGDVRRGCLWDIEQEVRP
ncbi:MAG: amidohydrolase family protein [Candidatus Neomarinimicrobiota bacterium]